jgi:hypothetical protein
MLVEEGDDLPRMPSETIVAVLETPCDARDPERLLLVAGEQSEGLGHRRDCASTRRLST